MNHEITEEEFFKYALSYMLGNWDKDFNIQPDGYYNCFISQEYSFKSDYLVYGRKSGYIKGFGDDHEFSKKFIKKYNVSVMRLNKL